MRFQYRFYKKDNEFTLWRHQYAGVRSWICIVASKFSGWRSADTSELPDINTFLQTYSKDSTVAAIEYEESGDKEAFDKIAEHCIVELL